MNSIRLQGHFLATTPWHVTEGSEGNETVVMKTKIVAGAATSDGRAPDVPPELASVPFVPANSVRARLRRSTLAILIDALMARGETISREAYQLLSNGGMLGSGDAATLTVGEWLRARKHIHFGLWGGGPRMIESNVVGCDMLPVCAETLAAGRVPEKYRDFAPTVTRNLGTPDSPQIDRQIAPGWKLIGKRMFKRNDDLLQLNEKTVTRLGVLGENFQELIDEYQAEQLGHRASRRDAKARTEGQDARTLSAEEQEALKKKELTNYLVMEIVAPGTVWPVDLRLDSKCTAAQVALFARGVEHFLNEDRIGSFGRFGFGQFKAYMDITEDGEVIGHVRWDEAAGKHVATFIDPSYFEVLHEELSQTTAAEIEMFAKTALVDSEKEAKKASKKKVATE